MEFGDGLSIMLAETDNIEELNKVIISSPNSFFLIIDTSCLDKRIKDLISNNYESKNQAQNCSDRTKIKTIRPFELL